MDKLDDKREALLELIRGLGSCGIAFSGGVDSAVVAMAAWEAIGTAAIAVTGISPSLALAELEDAKRLARQIGMRHELIETGEFDRPEYVRNEADRCFHCKTELYRLMSTMAERFGFSVILNGVNLDDLGRLPSRAGGGGQLCSPQPVGGMWSDQSGRAGAAQEWSLDVWDKPASPCLASRVAYGEEVTPQRLRMIEQAELWLRNQGIHEARVRYHHGDMARIEVPAEEIPGLVQPAMRAKLSQMLRDLGFKFISVDLEGFRSGSLNQLVRLDANLTDSGD